MKELKKLIDLKSIITLTLTIAMIIGFFKGLVETKDFTIIVMMVFTFYFSKKNTSIS